MHDHDANAEEYVEVPPEKLSPEALRGLMEEFILREGTDYGHQEKSLEDKYESVRKQLQAGKLVIAFNLVEESCTLLTKDEFRRNLDRSKPRGLR